eukprot:1143328-Pelagomonas_calceolata.AAC.7
MHERHRMLIQARPEQTRHLYVCLLILLNLCPCTELVRGHHHTHPSTDLRQRPPAHMLHHDAGNNAVASRRGHRRRLRHQAKHADDVGVVQASQHFRFAHEALAVLCEAVTLQGAGRGQRTHMRNHERFKLEQRHTYG